jgi:threonine dehydratase
MIRHGVDAAARELTLDDVRAAAARLRGVAHRTPVVTSRTLDERAGGRVFLKCENLQRMGAFKIRGAYNRLVQLTPDERARGVVAFSSGNHAQGVALAAHMLGIRATIVMPEKAPAAKRAATAGYGAEVVLYPGGVNREELAASLAEERGSVLVPPYDDEAIVAGAGTVALELLEDVGDLDVLLVPTGGGGLTAGCAIAASGLRPGIAIYGVEPEAGDDFARSFAAGERIEIPPPDTIADGQRSQIPGRITFPIVERLCAGILTVSDDQLRDAMRFAFERLKLVIEPSGAAALAAVLGGKASSAGKRTGVILSGGNVDAAHYAAILAG